MRALVLSFTLLGTALSSNAAAAPCPLATVAVYISTINSAGGCTVDDLLFSNFTYTPSASAPGVAIAPEGVTVNPLSNGSGFGLQLVAGFGAVAPGNVHSVVQFTVQTVSRAATISGLNITFNGTHTGTGTSGVNEIFCPGGTTVPPGPSCTGALQLVSSDSIATLSSSATFAPTQSVSVRKDIFVDGGAGPGTATISSVTDQFVTSPASPSACVANALQTLVGVWTFSTFGAAPPIPFVPAGPFVSAGQFVASLGAGGSTGILTITNSSSVVRLETDSGIFQVFPDCSGGTLTFNLSSRPLTFDFWFTRGGTEIRFVSTTSGVTLRGIASRGAAACPANGNALQSLVGTWTFSSEGFAPLTPSTPERVFAAAGQFVADATGGNPTLTILNTASQDGQLVRQETDGGKYQIFPDCSGGTLYFNLSSRPLVLDFWFTKGGTEIRFLGITPGLTISGTADRL